MPDKFSYPYSAVPNGEGGFIAKFRDIPEALTEAPTIDELREMALDALITAIDFYIEDGKALPSPSAPRKGELIATLPPSVAAKVLLLNTMAEQNCRQADPAKKSPGWSTFSTPPKLTRSLKPCMLWASDWSFPSRNRSTH